MARSGNKKAKSDESLKSDESPKDESPQSEESKSEESSGELGSNIEIIDGVTFLTLQEDIDGKPFLEGQNPKAVKDLWETGCLYEEIKTERIRLGKREGELKKELEVLYGKYPQFFVPSANDPKLLIYSIGGLVVDAQLKESVEIKTHKDSPPPISSAAQGTDQKSAPTVPGDEKVLNTF
jgi:hypothetical protein